jgi:hypothetical protein
MYLRTKSQKFSPSHFGVSSSQTTELQGAHVSFVVSLVSLMCNIEYNEFDSNWGINNLSNIIMLYRDLNAADRILWAFISGDFMHICLNDLTKIMWLAMRCDWISTSREITQEIFHKMNSADKTRVLERGRTLRSAMPCAWHVSIVSFDR